MTATTANRIEALDRTNPPPCRSIIRKKLQSHNKNLSYLFTNLEDPTSIMANDNAPQTTTKINSNSRNAMNASAMANSNGDCSDNSAVSLGNNSFGFNFDEEYQSPVNLDAGTKSDEDNRRSLKNNCRSTVQQDKQRTTLAMQNASNASEKGVGTAESSADAASKVRQMQRIAAQCFPAINPSSMGSSK